MSTRIFDASRTGERSEVPFALSLSKGGPPVAPRYQGKTALRQAQRERGWGFALLLLAGCSEQTSQNAAAPSIENTGESAAAQPDNSKIPCAAPGAADLTPACTVDRAETPDGLVLTLRHPDGAFHRLQITRDGRGVIAADGAEPARVTPLGRDRIEVEIGGARYQLPAIVRQ